MTLKIVTRIELSKDMAETLYNHFDDYAIDGVLTIEITTQGLWLPHPIAGRQFLGLARLPNDKLN